MFLPNLRCGFIFLNFNFDKIKLILHLGYWQACLKGIVFLGNLNQVQIFNTLRG